MSWDPVYRFVKKIPRGRVTTYGAVAKALRLPAGARAVGYALAACPSGQGIPWHRVLGAGGKIRVPEPHAALPVSYTHLDVYKRQLYHNRRRFERYGRNFDRVFFRATVAFDLLNDHP